MSQNIKINQDPEYFWKEAQQARKEGDIERAETFEYHYKLINRANHPFNSDQLSKLHTEYKKSGNYKVSTEIEETLKVKRQLETPMSSNELYKMARIYEKCGDEKQAKALKEHAYNKLLLGL